MSNHLLDILSEPAQIESAPHYDSRRQVFLHPSLGAPQQPSRQACQALVAISNHDTFPGTNTRGLEKEVAAHLMVGHILSMWEI